MLEEINWRTWRRQGHTILEHFEREKAEQNLKTILVNQKLLKTKTNKEKSQKEDEAKKNAQNILNTLRKKQVVSLDSIKTLLNNNCRQMRSQKRDEESEK